MAPRPVLVLLAVGAVALVSGCGTGDGGSQSTTAGSSTTAASTTVPPSSDRSPTVPPSTSTEPPPPRPAELLDAELVFFDADGQDNQREDPAPGRITDASQLAAFQARYVDGDPALPAAAAGALAAGDRVLIGGVVSSGCFPADYARLALMDGDVRLLGMGGRVAEPNTECVRVITSVGLVSVRAADLPAGATVQGT